MSYNEVMASKRFPRSIQVKCKKCGKWMSAKTSTELIDKLAKHQKEEHGA